MIPVMRHRPRRYHDARIYTELHVRLVSMLLALPMSFAIWRSAEILFGGTRTAASATILL
jgi:hypothetical protein